MRHRHKELGEPFNKAQSCRSRLEDWARKVVIFPPDQTVQPYIADNEGVFHGPRNPLQRVHERYNTDVTRTIFWNGRVGGEIIEAIGVGSDPQAVKARREVVPRAMSSVSQTRVWNVLIDVVAQSGHFKPNANNLQNDFIVEGEQHYWVHVAIDRFTGQVIDKQIEVVNE